MGEDAELYEVDATMMELRQEALDRRTDEQDKLVKVVQLRDLSCLGVAKLAGNAMMMNRLRKIVNNSLVAYPETLQQVLLLNAPSAFSGVWNIVSPLLNARVQSKVKFLHPGNLQEIIDAAGLASIE